MNAVRALLREPRIPDAPGPLLRDWLLVAAIAILAVVEVTQREDMVWLPLSVLLTLCFSLSLPWRRLHPLPLLMLVFGANTSVQVYALLDGTEWTGMYTTVLVLVLPYALLRWGSGQEAAAGLGFILACFATTTILSNPPAGEIVGAALFILFPSSLGLAVRFQSAAQQRAVAELRSREREQLARELHDTVGHYVSAIAIQAQAGKALAPTAPEAPLQALETIEDAASRALTEMRNILRAMRDGEAADFAPGVTVSDIERLAEGDAYPFAIRLMTSGELEQLDASIIATLYRLAQESITNAARHAREPARLDIDIRFDGTEVHLRVTDDGEAVSGSMEPGMGLRGMSERVKLLGGRLTAGPGDERGWVVAAALPAEVG